MNPIQLHTQRTTLRRIHLNDLEVVHQLHILPETDQYNTQGIPKNREETKSIMEAWIEANSFKEQPQYTFVIETKTDQAFIGIIALKLGRKKYADGEIWYKLHSAHWNKGYATEAAIEIIRFGFDELRLHRIQAGCAVDNIGSVKVLEKAGMTREGRARKTLPLKTGWSDHYNYAILESDKRKQA